jgi:hypothetical protein
MHILLLPQWCGLAADVAAPLVGPQPLPLLAFTPCVRASVCGLVRVAAVQDAVVLADCLPARFGPVTSTRAKPLLPLVNVPMLDYTLEWLASQCTDVRVGVRPVLVG